MNMNINETRADDATFTVNLIDAPAFDWVFAITDLFDGSINNQNIANLIDTDRRVNNPTIAQ
jgi:hypothetical protein